MSHAKRISYHQQLSLGGLCINLTFSAAHKNLSSTQKLAQDFQLRVESGKLSSRAHDNASVKVLLVFSGQGETDAWCWGWQESDKIIVRIAQGKVFHLRAFSSSAWNAREKFLSSSSSSNCIMELNVPFYGRVSTMMLFNYYLQWFLMLYKSRKVCLARSCAEQLHISAACKHSADWIN